MEKILGRKVKDVVKLHGDASYRAYYRATLEDGATYIIMQMPPGKSSVSEEITNFGGKHNELPFINVNRFLASCGLPVPKIFRYDEVEKIMVLEDLGDGLMFNFVAKAGNAERERYYKKAIDLLAEMQRKTTPHPLPSPLRGEGEGECIALKRSFDATLLNWEFDHFREYLIEERGGVKMDARDKELFETETRKITKEILKVPYCFTHRDLQSRNLIVRVYFSLAFIDFQDALLGPHFYDLVALLRDSYVELEWGLVERLIGYYNSNVAQAFRSANSGRSKDLRYEVAGLKACATNFHLVTLQRKMKDAGRFVYIDRVKKNPNFLQYIPTTLGYVKNAFERTNEYGGLFKMLKKYVPEWK